MSCHFWLLLLLLIPLIEERSSRAATQSGGSKQSQDLSGANVVHGRLHCCKPLPGRGGLGALNQLGDDWLGSCLEAQLTNDCFCCETAINLLFSTDRPLDIGRINATL